MTKPPKSSKIASWFARYGNGVIPVNLAIDKYYYPHWVYRILAFDKNWSFIGEISCPCDKIESDELLLREGFKNESLNSQIVESLPEYFIDTGRTIKWGFHDCRVFKFVSWE